MGKIPILTNIFQLGWNHQLVTHPIQRIILYICINTWFDKFHKKTQLRILGLDPFLFAFDENYKYVLLQISWPQKNTKKTPWLLGSDPKAQKYDTSLLKSHNEEIVFPNQKTAASLKH